jgi:hypothetical protein
VEVPPVSEAAAVATAWWAWWTRRVGELGAALGESPEIPLGEDELERLRALGYAP